MGYFSEDATVPAGLLLLAAVGFLLALRTTQQGKYLVRALIAAVLAAVVLVVEWFWVTDSERIQQVIHGLRDAVAESDAETVIGYMTPDVMYVKGDVALDGNATRAMIRDNLEHVRFDFVRISNLETHAFAQSRRGTARFSAFFKGRASSSVGSASFGSTNSIWSLGLQETAPGTWKVNRITPVQVPGDGFNVPGASRSRRGFR